MVNKQFVDEDVSSVEVIYFFTDAEFNISSLSSLLPVQTIAPGLAAFQSIIGKPLQQVIPSVCQKQLLKAKEKIESGEDYLYSFEIKEAAGGQKDKWVKWEIIGSRDKDERVTGFFISRRNINDYKIKENKLAIDQTINQSLLENTIDGLLMTDKKGKIILLNEEFERLFQLAFGKAPQKGDSLFSIFPEEYLPEVREIVNLISENKTFDKNQLIKTTLGDRWYDVKIKPVFNKINEIIGASATIRDITQSKLLELALKQSEIHYQTLSENLPGILFEYAIHKNGTEEFIYVSPTVEKVLGLTKNDFRNFQQFVHQDNLESFLIKINHTKQTREPLDVVGRMVRPGQEPVWLSVKANFSFETDEGSEIFTGIVSDITERKNSEKMIEDSERHLRALSENTPGVLYEYVFKPDGTECFRYISPSSIKLLGLSVDDFVKFPSYGHPEDLPGLLEKIHQSKITNCPFYFEGRLLVPGKNMMWLSIQSSYSYTTETGDRIFTGIVSDITEKISLQQKLDESELKKKKIIIDAQEKERKELAYELNENINQELASCKILLQLAQAEKGNNAQFLEQVSKSIEKLILETRSISESLTPHVIQDLGLTAAIKNLVEMLEQNEYVFIKFNSGLSLKDELKIYQELKLSVFRIVQETFNYLVKRKIKSTVTINLSLQQSELKIDIGCTSKEFNNRSFRHSSELAGIYTRVDYHRGHIEITADAEGCELNVILPLPVKSKFK
jgi:PAS domain S-box-containing protein